MRYPFTITVDLEIFAMSYEQAQKVAEGYVQEGFITELVDYPEVCVDQFDVVEWHVNDCDPADYDECQYLYTIEMRCLFDKAYKTMVQCGTPWLTAWDQAEKTVEGAGYDKEHLACFKSYTHNHNKVRRCSQCGKPMFEGFYFESDGETACCRECLEVAYDHDIKAMEADLKMCVAMDRHSPLKWEDWGTVFND